MSERDEIVELINRYALAVDAQRWALFDTIFTSDCIADFGSSAHWTDLATFKSDFAAFHASFDATQHLMMNHQVRIAGDRARSLTYGSWRLVRRAAEGGPLWDGSGWYDDAWVRLGDGWRIAHRVCRVIWFTGNDKVRETMPGVVFADERTTLRQEDLGFLKDV